MPAAIIPAAIGGVTSLVGGILGNRASGQAQDKQLAANEEALAYEQEQEARRRQDWEQAMAQYTAGRNQLLARYGVAVPGGGGAPQGPPGAVPRGIAPGGQPMGPPQFAGAGVPETGYGPRGGGPAILNRAPMPQGGPQMPGVGRGRPVRAARASRGEGLSLGELAMRRGGGRLGSA